MNAPQIHLMLNHVPVLGIVFVVVALVAGLWSQRGSLVRFGLFTLVWDHLMRTYSYNPTRRFDSTQLGMAAHPDYPTAYGRQLIHPFTPAGGCSLKSTTATKDPTA